MSDKKSLRGFAVGFAAVAEATGLTLGGFGVGFAIDKALKSSPWGAMIVTFLGLIVGFYRMYQIVNAADEKKEL